MSKTDFALGVLSSLVASFLFALGCKAYAYLQKNLVHIGHFSFNKNFTARAVLPAALFAITLFMLVNPFNKVLAPSQDLKTQLAIKYYIDSSKHDWVSLKSGRRYKLIPSGSGFRFIEVEP